MLRKLVLLGWIVCNKISSERDQYFPSHSTNWPPLAYALGTLSCCESSVSRFGDFWKVLATKFLAKVAKMIGNFLGYLEKTHYYVKLHWLLFGQLLEKIGLLFTPTSGHTGCDRKRSFIVLVSVGPRTAITLKKSCSTPKRTFRTARAIRKQALAFDDARSRLR